MLPERGGFVYTNDEWISHDSPTWLSKMESQEMSIPKQSEMEVYFFCDILLRSHDAEERYAVRCSNEWKMENNV
ncbi:hypothetical protein DW094_11285 [Ruminococcaceae bacterium AM07-15]|nr:hypothetical protein DW094_11285 [Ruminococcaceae bacterium AM07-15]